MRNQARITRIRRSWLPVGVLVVVPMVVLAGCGGSAIQPKDALAANNAILGQANQPGSSTGVVPDGTGTDVPGGQPTTPGQIIDNNGGNPNQTGGGPAQSGGQSSNPASPGGGGGGLGVKVGSCTGFKNTTGITNDTITIGNTADVSGPIPGLFTSARQATQAYVAYFNSRSNICGRKLALKTYDSRTDAGANQTTYASMCSDTFAAVGSASAFDSGGARIAQDCSLPDILAAALTPERNACTTCFGIQTSGKGQFPNATYDFWTKRNKAATQKAAFLYLNAGAAATNAQVQISVAKKRGYKFVYTSPIDVADFNYGPYVQQMKSKGVQFVQFIGGYQQGIRLIQAMQQAAFSPPIRLFDQSVYDQGFLGSGGSAINGIYLTINFTPFNEKQAELDLYLQWLNQVAPGATPSFTGLFAWSAAKLFVQEALQLGGKLSRSSLVALTKEQNNWTANGLHAAAHVGDKTTAPCVRYITVTNGKFESYGGTKYMCDGVTNG